MGLPGHRRTSSHKRRRASHFALTKPALTTDKAGRTHRMHRVAPNATEYNGTPIHVKGLERKMQKMLDKTKPASAQASTDKPHDHEHEVKK
ncbi:MAG: 50S ribosomal protein L32 [Patescibacteria group bacterium]